MKATSKTQESHKRAGMFIIAMAGMSAAIAWAFIGAMAGDALTTFIATFIAWNGYLIAHHTETGRLVDPRQNDPVMPLARSEMALAALGIITLLTGIGIIALTGAEASLLTMTAGTGVVMTGYLIAHYAMTDLLL